MNPIHTVLIIGAGSSIGQGIASAASREGCEVTGIARFRPSGGTVAGPYSWISADWPNPEDPVWSSIDPSKFDAIVICAGYLPTDLAAARLDPAEIRAVYSANVETPIRIVEGLAPHMKVGSTLAVITSVAGERVRGSNDLYGAAKAAMQSHLVGLRHRYGQRIKVVDIRPGPTSTPMTAHLADKKKLADPDEVGALIWEGLCDGDSVIRAPAKWNLIMTVFRLLPEFALAWLVRRGKV